MPRRVPLIHDTTRWVTVQAACDLPKMSSHMPDFSLAINVPPNQLCDIVIERTERQMLDHTAPALAGVLAELRLLEALVPLLREFGVIIIAEGVESERQLERVRLCGVRFAQGFLFSRPLELEQVSPISRARQRRRHRPDQGQGTDAPTSWQRGPGVEPGPFLSCCAPGAGAHFTPRTPPTAPPTAPTAPPTTAPTGPAAFSPSLAPFSAP